MLLQQGQQHIRVSQPKATTTPNTQISPQLSTATPLLAN